MASTNVISSVLGRAVDSVAGGTDIGVPCLAVRDDVLSTLTPADGDYTPLRVDSQGALHVTHAADSGSGSVTNDGTFAVQVDGTALSTWPPSPARLPRAWCRPAPLSLGGAPRATCSTPR